MRLSLSRLRSRRSYFPLLVLYGVFCLCAFYALKSRKRVDLNLKSDLNNDGTGTYEPNAIRVVTSEETQGGSPVDPDVKLKRNTIREMMKHAWSSYAKHAWGSNELSVDSKSGHQAAFFGTVPMGITIIDSLDTLFIMELNEEFESARRYVKDTLNFRKYTKVSLFEFNIRVLGGLLSAYSLTMDEIFLQKAVELADRLLPAFKTSTGIPMSLVNLLTGDRINYNWMSGGCSSLADVGTLHMEFTYLSELTGNAVYARKVHRIREVIRQIHQPSELFFNAISPNEPRWCDESAGLASLADSFYEYLLKEWIRTNHRDTVARVMYDEGIQALLTHDVFRYSKRGHLYLCPFRSVNCKMEHLACFAGGMLALGAANISDPWFDRGKNVTETCRLSYASSRTHLGPESFTYSVASETVPVARHNLLRPETVESYFYLWRLTKDSKYRDWAWDLAVALENYSRTPDGYAGLRNVDVPGQLDGVQQAYFLAETLKYLYLIFSEDTLLPLNRWVFNTEAHPFPVRDRVILKHGYVWPKPFKTSQDPENLSSKN
ncbi:unnamed protein product [Calicophoron daubneyi]|uniref:alpha-1,2-Mannosidase n=1 Tax=Calicophoron daubneyi TaxID=300641 RepID=A0AAV2T8C4_CALDB